MIIHYLYWHYVRAPLWLARLEWNIERGILRYFSVGVMLRTMVSHWHQDRVSYQQGSISGMAKALAFNLISRGIGVIARLCVLFVWSLTQGLYAFGAIVFFALFLAWPIVTILSLLAGFAWLGT